MELDRLLASLFRSIARSRRPSHFPRNPTTVIKVKSAIDRIGLSCLLHIQGVVSQQYREAAFIAVAREKRFKTLDVSEK